MSQVIGAVLAILLGMMSLPQLMTHSRNANNNIIASNIAQQAIQFNDAVTRYVQTYPTQVQAAATATTPLVITVPMLQSTGFLPASFRSQTPYGNTFQAQVLQPTAGNLQVLALTTGGSALPDNRAVKIAHLVGSAGGFIPLNDTGKYAGGAANAHGTAWGPASTANFNVSGGQLASLLTFNNGQLTDNRLYRNAVPGQPQLNTMNTPLIMGAGTIQTENTACTPDGAVGRAASGQLLSCQAGFWKFPGSSYWRDPVATFTALPTTGDPVGAVRMTRDTGRAFMWTGGSWNPLAVDQNGNLTVPGTLTAAGGRVIAWNQANGGVLELVGANGTSIFLQSNNGTFRLVNSPWNNTLFTVDQSGNVAHDGSLTAGGRVDAGEYVRIRGTAVEGDACTPNGLVGRTTASVLLSCQSGVWKRANGTLGLASSACPASGKTTLRMCGNFNTYRGGSLTPANTLYWSCDSGMIVGMSYGMEYGGGTCGDEGSA